MLDKFDSRKCLYLNIFCLFLHAVGSGCQRLLQSAQFSRTHEAKENVIRAGKVEKKLSFRLVSWVGVCVWDMLYCLVSGQMEAL